MRVLFWYCDKFAGTPAIKTPDQVPISEADGKDNNLIIEAPGHPLARIYKEF